MTPHDFVIKLEGSSNLGPLNGYLREEGDHFTCCPQKEKATHYATLMDARCATVYLPAGLQWFIEEVAQR